MTENAQTSEQAAYDADVLIAGAGISGLTVAQALTENGWDVVVVEADERVGGRTWSGEEPGGTLDYGGMYVGKDHNDLIALGTKLGLRTVPVRRPGKMVYKLPSGRIDAPDGDLDGIWANAPELYRTFGLLDDLSREVGVRAPWNSPRAAELDSQTVATWFDQNVPDPDVRAIHEAEVNGILGSSPADVSLFFWVYTIASGQGINSLRFDVNDALWLGGAQQISTRIAERLGSRVRLNWPVSDIHHGANGVTAWNGAQSLRAKYLVLAMPPASAARVRFHPQLPHQRHQLQQRSPMARMVKVQVRYQTPFWRDAGFSGEICDTTDIGVVVLDVTRPGDEWATAVGFIGGRDYDAFMARSESQRQERFVGLLTDVYGAAAAQPEFYHETRWPEQRWQMGGPVSTSPPGALSANGAALREPIGNIHFAGTEASLAYTGYMEGAVRAGIATAKKLSVGLSDQSQPSTDNSR